MGVLNQAGRVLQRRGVPLYALPDFVIIGTMKGGTTSLFAYLRKHPQVIPAQTKEVHFFDEQYAEGVAWYRMQFPSYAQKYWHRLNGRRCITGEASPYYLFHPDVPQRMQAVLPKVKLITLLRNPIDRAYSHYQHQVRKGREHRPFEEAVAEEQARLEAQGQPGEATYEHRHFSYLERGLYLTQLRRWRQFFPGEQMLILESEALYQAPEQTLKEVYAFLGLHTASFPDQLKAANVGRYKEKMSSTCRAQLAAFYAPHNQALCAYLKRDFSWAVSESVA